jgi:hypothetical protein
MFKGKINGEMFLLFHNSECLVSQTLEDYGSFERIRKRLPLLLVRAFFVEHFCDYFARLKANRLCPCVLAQRPLILNFAMEETCSQER